MNGVIFMLVVLAAALVLAGPRLSRELQQRRLHAGLARASALTTEEARWLWQFARCHCPSQPALVFVRPGLFAADGLSGASPIAVAVRDKLFC